MLKSGIFTLPRAPRSQLNFFLCTSKRRLASCIQTPKVNQERLWNDIHYTCQWGKGERWGKGENETGMSRLSLSDSDRMSRDWFVETTKSLNCNVQIDAMGNIFAVRKGRRQGPPTCAGSHLDTQPTGGRYDGILGVCAGVEMLRVLQEDNIDHEYPVGVINWTNEEGARFPISMISSGVWAGRIPLEKAHNLQEVRGGKQTIRQELQRIGYLGTLEASYKAMPIGAHFELHIASPVFTLSSLLQIFSGRDLNLLGLSNVSSILTGPNGRVAYLCIEQGPRLEARNHKIGIVQGVQAYRWHTITVKGRDCHTGTTDFANRSDAMLTAAKMILHSHRLATKHSCLASTGILTLSPGSTNTVPGTVSFSLDIRGAEDDRLMGLENQLKRDFDKIAHNEPVDELNEGGTIGRGCTVEWVLDAPSQAIKFDKDCIQCVEDSAKELFGDEHENLTQTMISGAGHDSVFTSHRVPTSMIFVPCKDGVSHNPTEYCSPEDCANGAQVLMGAVLRYDKLRAERAG